MGSLFDFYYKRLTVFISEGKKVVDKIWGWEIWLANRGFCGKILLLKKGYRCSLHSHTIKDESFHLVEGSVLLETDSYEHIMYRGDTAHVLTDVKHRFSGLENSVIIEFSTHHKDEDSYRVEGQLSGKIEE